MILVACDAPAATTIASAFAAFAARQFAVKSDAESSIF